MSDSYPTDEERLADIESKLDRGYFLDAVEDIRYLHALALNLYARIEALQKSRRGGVISQPITVTVSPPREPEVNVAAFYQQGFNDGLRRGRGGR